MDFDKLRELYVDKRLSSQEVAWTMGVHVSTVERNLRKMGWTRNPSQRKLSDEAYEVLNSREKLYDLYVAKGITYKEIAANLGVGASTVRRALDALEITRRSTGEARTSNDAYLTLREAPTLTALYERLGLSGTAVELGVNRQTVANHLVEFGVEISKGSSGENALAYELDGQLDLLRNYRKIIPPFEVDIYIPEQRFAIEFNGVYWHTEEMVGKDYHKKKFDLCAEKGVRLIQVWEDEWTDRRPAVLSMLRHKLGISLAPRIPARGCSVVTVPGRAAYAFHEVHHVQGGANCSVSYGLERDDELVAVCSFLATGDEWELVRYSTSAVVVGGFSRTLSAFMRNEDWSEIKTFADLCVSDGALYEECGFTKVATLAPDYKYVVNDRRVHKFNYRKSRFESDPDLFFDPSMTESELATANGLSRIWDAGKIKYLLKNGLQT